MKRNGTIKKLKSRSAQIRNVAALDLMETKPNGAREALLRAALNKKHIGKSGTLVYALESFDCSDFFPILFDLAIFGTYEVKCMALGILVEQTFKPSETEMLSAEYKVESIKENWFQIEDKEKLIYSLSYILRKIKKGNKAKLKRRVQ